MLLRISSHAYLLSQGVQKAMKSVNMPFKSNNDLEVSAFFQAEFIVGAQNSKQYGWHLVKVLEPEVGSVFMPVATQFRAAFGQVPVATGGTLADPVRYENTPLRSLGVRGQRCKQIMKQKKHQHKQITMFEVCPKQS